MIGTCQSIGLSTIFSFRAGKNCGESIGLTDKDQISVSANLNTPLSTGITKQSNLNLPHRNLDLDKPNEYKLYIRNFYLGSIRRNYIFRIYDCILLQLHRKQSQLPSLGREIRFTNWVTLISFLSLSLSFSLSLASLSFSLSLSTFYISSQISLVES